MCVVYCVCVYSCVCVQLCAYMHTLLCVCVLLCVRVYSCVYVYTSVCVCVYTRVCMYYCVGGEGGGGGYTLVCVRAQVGGKEGRLQSVYVRARVFLSVSWVCVTCVRMRTCACDRLSKSQPAWTCVVRARVRMRECGVIACPNRPCDNLSHHGLSHSSGSLSDQAV